MVELDDPPKLDARKKHDIEIVVDRLAVKPDIEQRLAESFETALKLAEGVALIAFIERAEEGADRVLEQIRVPDLRLQHSPSSSRGSSPSTTRPARARTATASACGCSSTPRG